MKKILLPLIVSSLVLISTTIWINFSDEMISVTERIQILVILLLVVFGIYFSITRLKSKMNREPIEDEMSKYLVLKTSSLSYFISLYIWVAILFFKDRFPMDMEIWIGTGILAMALTFATVFLVLKFIGIKNDK
jgi:hypothetical protein